MSDSPFRARRSTFAAGIAAGLALDAARRARGAARRNPPAGRIVEVDGLDVHLLDRGRGVPVVLLHGAGSTLDEIGLALIPAASRAGWRTVLMDRPGHGHSQRRVDLATPNAQADLVRAALDRLGIGAAAIVGHSYGAAVALAFGLRHPDRALGIVTVSGFVHPAPRMLYAPFVLPGVPVLGHALAATVYPIAWRRLLPWVAAKLFAPQPVPERLVREFPAELLFRPRHIHAASEDALLLAPALVPLSRRYPELRPPLAIVAGAEDRFAPPEDHALPLGRAVPGASLRLVPRAGHMVHHARPDAVAEAVEDVLRRATKLPKTRSIATVR